MIHLREVNFQANLNILRLDIYFLFLVFIFLAPPDPEGDKYILLFNFRTLYEFRFSADWLICIT